MHTFTLFSLAVAASLSTASPLDGEPVKLVRAIQKRHFYCNGVDSDNICPPGTPIVPMDQFACDQIAANHRTDVIAASGTEHGITCPNAPPAANAAPNPPATTTAAAAGTGGSPTAEKAAGGSPVTNPLPQGGSQFAAGQAITNPEKHQEKSAATSTHNGTHHEGEQHKGQHGEKDEVHPPVGSPNPSPNGNGGNGNGHGGTITTGAGSTLPGTTVQQKDSTGGTGTGTGTGSVGNPEQAFERMLCQTIEQAAGQWFTLNCTHVGAQ